MLRAILRHVRRILAFVAMVPFRLVAWLFGTGGAPVEPTANFEEVADEQVEELRDELEAPARELTPVNLSLGERIHEYASGDYQTRGSFDLSGMPDHVAVALCVMPPEQLARLAAAGPDICRRWAAGEKTGLVGVPSPSRDWRSLSNLQGAEADAEIEHELAAPIFA
jgi:hypothetical protein